MSYANCMDCPDHLLVEDPDPNDWFCDDDVAVVCTASPRPVRENTEYAVDRQPFRSITVGCRPYNTRKECSSPDWCPLKKRAKRS